MRKRRLGGVYETQHQSRLGGVYETQHQLVISHWKTKNKEQRTKDEGRKTKDKYIIPSQSQDVVWNTVVVGKIIRIRDGGRLNITPPLLLISLLLSVSIYGFQ